MLIVSLAVPALAVAQRTNTTQTVSTITSEDLKVACGVDVNAALRSMPPADRPDMSKVQECNDPNAVYIGMDAGFAHLSPDGDDGSNLFRLPIQSLRVTFPVGPQFRLEVPVALSWSHVSDFSSTSIETGIIGDMFLNNLLGSKGHPAGTGLYAGIGGMLHFVDFDGSSDTQFGLLGRAGYEFPFNNTRMRLGAMFEKRFETDSTSGGNVFGVTWGVGFPIYGERYHSGSGPNTEGVDRVSIQFFTGANYSKPSEGDGETSIDIPVPTFGLMFHPGDTRQLGIGARTSFTYGSSGGDSYRYLYFNPRVEYNLTPNFFTSNGVRIGAQAIINNVNYDYGSSNGGTQFGVGGDVSLTIPHVPNLFVLGVGVDRLFKNEDIGRRASTNIRIDVGIDRFLFDSRH